MPRHVDDLRTSDSFPVKPGTNEYHALSFPVANQEVGFTPASASKTMTRLFEKGLIERAQGTYYVEPERADELKRRLNSLDPTARLFETAPDDDHAEPGWEDEVSSIDPDENRTTSDNDDARTTTAEADEPVSDLTATDDGA